MQSAPTYTHVCIDCGRSEMYAKASRAGRPRLRCAECDIIHKRNGTRERVAKMRASKPKQKQFIMHIRGCGKKSYCGKAIDFEEAGRWFVEHESHDWRYCKTCIRLFAEDKGITINK